MAEIRKLKDGELTVYPQTVGSAVILDDGTTVQDLADKTVDAQVLSVAPTLFVKKYGIEQHYDLDETFYDVKHPLMNIEGSEFVLMRYSKKILKKYVNNNYSSFGKTIPSGKSRARYNPKKGWHVAAGRTPNTIVNGKTYFTFAKDGSTTADDLLDYLGSKYNINGVCAISNPEHFGISLRIPNPDYTGPSTLNKNACYKGVYESLWSEPLMIHLKDYSSGDKFGIGVIK